jgi:hypothetical protein
LGVSKTLFLDIREWLITRNKNQAFIRHTGGILESIIILQLPWMKALPYTKGKFGGYVGENFVALTRLSMWFYSSLLFMESESTEWSEPLHSQLSWLKRDNVKWLKIRGLCTTGTSNEIRNRVNYFMNDIVPTPSPLPPPGGSAKEVIQILFLWHSYVSCMMQEKTNSHHINKAQILVRNFMSEYTNFVEQLYPNKKMASWISKYNFMSLFTITDQLYKFGSPKHVWEGGYFGEGFLRVVKPKVRNGLRKNWEINLMKSVLRQKSLNALIKNVKLDSDKETCNYHVYKNRAYLTRMLLQGSPISVCKIKLHENINNFVVIYYKMQRKVYSYLLTNQKITRFSNMNYQFFTLSIEENEVTTEFENYGCLFLPMLDDTGVVHEKGFPQYTIIDMNWHEY